MSSTAQPKLIRTALYIRVSSDEQARNGDSVRDQKEAGLAYINTHEDNVLQDIYVDDGVSGQKLDRDDFTRLMANVRDGKVDMIIFTKLDRWFRSLRHYLNTQATLEKYNVSWLAVNQPYFDTSTPYGRAFVAQSMTWAELEAQNGGIRVKDVFRNKVTHGEVITGKVPRGFKIVNKHLELNEDAPVIAQAFQTVWDEQSMGRGLQFLANHGIVMTINNFRVSVLMNEKYTGRYRGNDSYCPRIVSDELFDNVQRLIASRKSVKTSQRYPYVFSGLLVCEECGYHLGGCHINTVRHKNGNTYRYRYPAYECKQYRVGKRCSNGGEIREGVIERNILPMVREEMEHYVALYETRTAPAIDNRVKKAAIQKRLNKLKTLYLNDLITLDEYKADHDRYCRELEELPDLIQSNKNIDYMKKLLDTDFEAMYQTFSNEEKRFFWRSILKEIRVSRSEQRIRKYYPIFLNGSDR